MAIGNVALLGQDLLQHPPVVVSGSLHGQVERVGQGAVAGQELGEAALQGRARLGDIQPQGLGPVAGQDGGHAGAGDDGDPVPGKRWEGGKAVTDIQHLLDPGDPECPGLAHHGLEDPVRVRQGAGVRPRRRQSGGAASGLREADAPGPGQGPDRSPDRPAVGDEGRPDNIYRIIPNVIPTEKQCSQAKWPGTTGRCRGFRR